MSEKDANTAHARGLGINPTDPVFSICSLVLPEAQNGAGVLIEHEVLVRASLDDGSLVAPFEQQVELPRKLVIETPHWLRSGSLLEKIVHLLSEGDLLKCAVIHGYSRH